MGMSTGKLVVKLSSCTVHVFLPVTKPSSQLIIEVKKMKYWNLIIIITEIVPIFQLTYSVTM